MDRTKEEIEGIKQKLSSVLLRLGYEQITNDDKVCYCIQVNGKKDNEHIYLRADDDRHKDRIVVSGQYPRSKEGEYITPNSNISITISLTKSIEQIAKDITNRFLPSYRENIKLVLAQKERIDTAKENRDSIIKLVGEKLNIEPYVSCDKTALINKFEFSKNIENINIKSDYNGDSLTIEMRIKKELVLSFSDWLNQNKGVV